MKKNNRASTRTLPWVYGSFKTRVNPFKFYSRELQKLHKK